MTNKAEYIFTLQIIAMTTIKATFQQSIQVFTRFRAS